VICAVTTLMMGFTYRFEMFLVLAAVRAIAMGPILSTAPAMAGDLSPKDEAGHYMAYNNLSTGLSGGITALIFGVLLVNLNRTTFTYVFIIMAIFFLVGSLVFSNKVSQKELEAGFKAVEAAGESE
jgi:MFS family permease